MNRRQLLPRSRGLFRYAELWLEGDELLYLLSSRFSERYSRYRLGEIQALVLTEYPLWNPWRAIWLGFSAFFTLLLLVLTPGAWMLTALLPGLSLLGALLHVAEGPRCRLVLHTAVSTVTIEAVVTMKQAAQVMPELTRLVEGLQGHLSSDGLRVEPVSAAGVVHEEPPKAQSPLLLHILFGMLVAHALLLAVFYFTDKRDSGLGLSATFLLAEILMAAIAAFRWRQASVAITLLCGLTVVLALADGGVMTYTMVKTFGSFFAAINKKGVKPEDIEWLWLKEQTVGRAIWHAVAGLIGWVTLLATREKAS